MAMSRLRPCELSDSCLMFVVHPTITPERMADCGDDVRSAVLRALR